MAKNNLTYTKEKKSKNIIKGSILLVAAVLLLGGIISAFYSDAFKQSGTAETETLKISAAYTVYFNGEETTLSQIRRLNPGDTITVTGSVENRGSQSAWIRDIVAFSGADSEFMEHLKVYNAELYQADLLSQNTFPELQLQLSAQGVASAGNKVIDGSGENAQTASGEGPGFLGADNYSFALTVYFSHDAPNSTQGKTFNITVMTQALQYVNNNAAEPSENAWAAVALSA